MAGIVSPARKALQNKANLFVLIGLLLDLGGYAIAAAAHVRHLNQVFALIALPFWVIGLMAYAQSKGHSKWLGFLGLLTCCGLIIMVLLPNRWVEPGDTGYGPGDYPRPNA